MNLYNKDTSMIRTDLLGPDSRIAVALYNFNGRHCTIPSVKLTLGKGLIDNNFIVKVKL